VSDYSIKMYVLVNQSLDMTKGKAAAQIAHAVLKQFLDRMEKIDLLYMGEPATKYTLTIGGPIQRWLNERFTKVTLRVPTTDDIKTGIALAEASDVWVSEIRDDGRTQVDPNSLTVAAIGPFDTTDESHRELVAWLSGWKLY